MDIKTECCPLPVLFEFMKCCYCYLSSFLSGFQRILIILILGAAPNCFVSSEEPKRHSSFSNSCCMAFTYGRIHSWTLFIIRGGCWKVSLGLCYEGMQSCFGFSLGIGVFTKIVSFYALGSHWCRGVILKHPVSFRADWLLFMRPRRSFKIG